MMVVLVVVAVEVFVGVVLAADATRWITLRWEVVKMVILGWRVEGVWVVKTATVRMGLVVWR